jgi:hypothetical protein
MLTNLLIRFILKKAPTFILILILLLILFNLIQWGKEDMKDPKTRYLNFCKKQKQTEYSGFIVDIEFNNGTDYVLSNGQKFSRFCGDFALNIGDSIYKPSGTLNYYVYKFNPDTSFFVKCSFDCDSLLKKRP